MSSLKAKISAPARALCLFLVLAPLSGCQEIKSETAIAPLRPIDTTRSSVSVTNASNAEVAVAQTVTVRIADKSGAGINGVQPTITLVDGAGTVGANISVSACSVTNYSGLATCSALSNLPGVYYVKVTAPKAFTSTSGVTFVQKLFALQFSAQPSCANCTVATPFTTAVQILDRAGQPITSGAAAASTVALSLTSAGTATLAGTVSMAASAGVASFAGLSVNKIGSFTLTASSGVASGTSASFTLKAGVATKLAFITQPAPYTPSNVNLNPAPSVGLFDANDNLVSNTNCTITITRDVSSPAGTLLGTTGKISVNGVSDFALNLIRINTYNGGTGYRFKAHATGASVCLQSAPGVPLVDALSDPFEITLAGVPAQLYVSVPPGTAALSEVFQLQPEVQVLDVDGNLVSNDNSSVVTIAKLGTSPAGSLVGPSSVQVVNGVAKFANLYIDSTNTADAGTYNYRFTGTAPGVTLGFTDTSQVIRPDGQAAPFALEFLDQPQPAAKGQILPIVRVRKVDVGGYLNFTDSSTAVTVALGGGGILGGTLTKTLANGIATFNDLKVSGSTGVKTLTASASGLPNQVSSNFSISSFGTAAQLRFVGPINENHATGTNEWSSAPVVWVQDSANNLVVNDSTTTVAIQIFQQTGGSPVLMGSTTKTVANGVADFTGLGIRSQDLNLTNVVLSASSPSNQTLINGQSATFSGNIATATALRFTVQPVTGVKTASAGTCWVSNSSGTTVTPVSVAIVDANNNVITGDNTSAISVTCNNCAVTGTTSVSVVNGVATFNGLQSGDNRSGSVLTATSSGGLTRTSNAFNIPVCTP